MKSIFAILWFLAVMLFASPPFGILKNALAEDAVDSLSLGRNEAINPEENEARKEIYAKYGYKPLLSVDFWADATPQMVDTIVDDVSTQKLSVLIQQRDIAEWTPLMYAALINENPNVISLLIGRGYQVESTDIMGFSALMFAASSNQNPAILDFLISSGANVNARDARGWTPLMFAVHNNKNPDITATLINHGADVNARNGEGRTPLILAVIGNRNHQIIRILIEHDANVEITDNTGKSAWDYARDNKHIYNTPIYWLLNDKMKK